MSERIALSFVGANEYQPASYEIGGTLYQSRYVQCAIRDNFKPDRHLLLLTTKAHNVNAQGLISEGYSEDDFIRIPDGKSETELWELFTLIAGAVPENCELILDVTHGFRTQPMLALAVSVFLGFYKNVHVKHILYGAWDARNTETGITPVFDLIPFLDVIDWTFALRRFSEKGDAADLSEILRTLHHRSYRENADYKSRGLAGLGTQLENLMNALAVVRPREALQASAAAQKKLPDAHNDLKNIIQTKPLALMLEELEKAVSAFAPAGGQNLFSEEGIRSQVNMLRHYLEVGQFQQALTLATELLISIACIRMKLDPLSRDDRENVSYRLQGIYRKDDVGITESWEEKLAEITGRASLFRNDINHAGMRKAPKPAKSIVDNTRDIVSRTEEFVGRMYQAENERSTNY